MLLPQTTEYALRAMLHIAARHPAKVRVGDIAGAVGAPSNYLSKTLSQLVSAGLLHSARGPRGGFRLAHPPGGLTIGRIAAVFSDASPRRCLLGHGICGQTPHCPAHERWQPVARSVGAFLDTTTLADLLGQADGPSLIPRSV